MPPSVGYILDLGANTQALLESLPDPATESRRVMGVLINDVIRQDPDPFVFVLDDLHAVNEQAVHGALDYLLEHAPPALRLVAATRHDSPLPLARLRARGELAEFDLADLRFSDDEAGAWLNAHWGLRLSNYDIQTLQARTEGWAAGLRLLAASLSRVPTPVERSRFIVRVAPENRSIFELLAEEVLSRQRPELRAFLLETSILDELTPNLCRAVTQMQDAADLLEEAYRLNLFLTAIGDHESASAAYRYHALFAGFLRYQLEREAPEKLVELHWRVAEAQTVPERAIRHYLAARMWTEAAGLIEAVGQQMLQRGSLDTVRGWIEALPNEVRERRPHLLYLLGTCAAHQGRFAEAEPLLSVAASGLEVADDREAYADALMGLSFVVNGMGDFTRSADLMERALSLPLSARNRVQAHIGRAWVALYQHDQHGWTTVDAETRSAIETALGSGDIGAFGVLGLQLCLLLFFGSLGPEPFVRYCQQALARFGEGSGLIQVGAWSLLGSIYQAAREALAPYAGAEGVVTNGAAWLMSARR